jgi:hypothetical protein
MKRLYTVCILLLIVTNCCFAKPFDEHPTLPIGATAPAFNLKSVDGKFYSLASLKVQLFWS